jgi:hypothetical protein
MGLSFRGLTQLFCFPQTLATRKIYNYTLAQKRMAMEKDSNKYLEVCKSNKIWDCFLTEAIESSPFMFSWFSDISDFNNEKLLYIENGIPKAAVLLYKDGEKLIHPNYSVYHSLCFKQQETENVAERYRILGNIVAQLTDKYKEGLRFSFHPKIIDLRPLLWHNFEENKCEKFKVEIRYTAVLDLSSIKNIHGYLKEIRENRKRDYKKSIKEKISSSLGATKEEVKDLYKKTFERQGISVDSKSLDFLERLTENINSERGFIYKARNKDGQAIAITICLLDKDTAYSLFIANDPEYRNTGANTACMLGSLLYAREIGKKFFDFIGANSPQRGDFKLSFNSELKRYFESSYCPTSACVRQIGVLD